MQRLINHIKEIIKNENFEEREYQINVMRTIIQCIKRNNSVILNMPQGLGKTLVAQIISVILRKIVKNPKAKSLIVIPTRALNAQHIEMASWMRKYGELMEIHYRAVEDSFYLRNRFKVSNFIITTPVLFFNHLTSFDSEDLKDIKLCILDEIDTFSVPDWHRQRIIRFHKKMGKIAEFLINNNCLFLGLTASKINESYSFWSERINITVVKPSSTELHDYLPYNIIYPIGIEDAQIVSFDSNISDYIGKIHSKLQESFLSQGVDIQELSSPDLDILINKILKIGRGKTIKVKNRNLYISEEIYSLCSERRHWDNIRQKLYEDSLGLFKSSISENPKDISLIKEFPKLINQDLSSAKKAKFVLQFIKSRSGNKQGIVFCRFKPLVESLYRLGRSQGVNCNYIHGDLSAGQISKRINGFRKRDFDVLFMTNIGERGMDFPNADYMIIYSVRSKFKEMDQQICRIRSNRKHKKAIYLLTYENTQDEKKVKHLLKQMSNAKSIDSMPSYEIRKSLSIDAIDLSFNLIK